MGGAGFDERTSVHRACLRQKIEVQSHFMNVTMTTLVAWTAAAGQRTADSGQRTADRHSVSVTSRGLLRPATSGDLQTNVRVVARTAQEHKTTPFGARGERHQSPSMIHP
jgi:hypothetical protein